MIIVSDINVAIEKLNVSHPKLIGIDGIDGIGKTTMATKLASELQYQVISIDDYLNKNQGSYYKHIDFAKLKEDILTRNQVIVEGILLTRILNKIDVKCDFYIYATNNFWVYEWSEEFDGIYSLMPLEDIVSHAEELTNKIVKATESHPKIYKMSEYVKDIYTYSYKYRPWSNADMVFQI